MSVEAIEMRPIVAATATTSFGADTDNNEHDDVHQDVNVNSTLINADSEASPLSSTLQTAGGDGDDTITTTKRMVVARKYLSMIMVAYILTILSPGTKLWSPNPFLLAATSSAAPCISNNAQFMDESSPTSTEKSAAFSDTLMSDKKIDETLHIEAASVSKHNISDERLSNDNCTMMNHVGPTVATINILLLTKLTACTIILIRLFFNLQGSDPGILNKDILCRLKDDGIVTENKKISTPASTDDDNDDNYKTNSIDCNDDDEGKEDSDIEQQCFLEPLSQTSLSTETDDGDDSSHSRVSLPQQNHGVDRGCLCYPHTRRKYCHICEIHPPIRSHHCNICQACVATFDHHCVFLGTCIGERNHFRFWFFVLWNVLCFYLALGIVNSGSVVSHFGAKNGSGIGSVISALLGYHHDEYDTSEQEDDRIAIRAGQLVLFVAKLYMYPLYGIATLLLIIHTVNVLGNCTTFELTKGPEHIDYLVNTRMMDFPFASGLFNNIRSFVMRDDFVSIGWFLWRQWQLKRGYCKADGIRVEKHADKNDATTTNIKPVDDEEFVWVPIVWKLPTYIDRESEDWWNHPWSNKYWSCC